MKNWTKIWTEIAVAYGMPESDKSERQDYITNSGLCRAMAGVGSIYDIPMTIVQKNGYWWRCGKKGDTYRAFFAGLMAAMGDKGFADFLKWCEEHP